MSSTKAHSDKPESENIYWSLQNVSVLPERKQLKEDVCEWEACQCEVKTLREKLEARDLELQRVKEKNLDLAKKNEFLEKELNVEKDILQTVVELKVEVSPCYIK